MATARPVRSSPITWKRAAVLGVMGSLLALLMAASTPVTPPYAASAPAMPVTVPQKATLEVEMVKLRERQSAHAPPARTTRNLFAFGRTTSAGGTLAPVHPIPTSEWSAWSPNPGAVTFTLVGIAEERRAAGTVRTAILSSPHVLQFVHEGDDVEGGLRAGSITSDAIELQTDDGRSFVLRLQ